jgi:hypothetical protein
MSATHARHPASNPNDPVTFLHPTPNGYLVYRDAVIAAIG